MQKRCQVRPTDHGRLSLSSNIPTFAHPVAIGLTLSTNRSLYCRIAKESLLLILYQDGFEKHEIVSLSTILKNRDASFHSERTYSYRLTNECYTLLSSNRDVKSIIGLEWKMKHNHRTKIGRRYLVVWFVLFYSMDSTLFLS